MAGSDDFKWDTFWPASNKRCPGLGYMTKRLERARIPGGWLIKFWLWSGSQHSSHAICFVPDSDELWESQESELEKLYIARGVNTCKMTLRKRLGEGWLYIDTYYAAGSGENRDKGHQSIDMVWVPDSINS